MMKLREDLNNLVKKYQSGGLKRLLDEENSSDSNSIINYTKLRNIDPKKVIKNKTDRIENLNDNVIKETIKNRYVKIYI